MKKHTPTREQLDALANFAANEGRNWKAALRHAWETGDYPTGSQSAELQQVRNSFCPGWLIGFMVRPVGSKYTASDMGTSLAVIAEMEERGNTTPEGYSAFMESETLEALTEKMAVVLMEPEEDQGDYSEPCQECSATGQHYLTCSQS